MPKTHTGVEVPVPVEWVVEFLYGQKLHTPISVLESTGPSDLVTLQVLTFQEPTGPFHFGGLPCPCGFLREQ